MVAGSRDVRESEGVRLWPGVAPAATICIMDDNEQTQPELPANEVPYPETPAWFEAQLAERDESIRLLNEALSLALDELQLREAA